MKNLRIFTMIVGLLLISVTIAQENPPPDPPGDPCQTCCDGTLRYIPFGQGGFWFCSPI